ncbi:hypothetical protein D3C73_1146550 [compost metagenome]
MYIKFTLRALLGIMLLMNLLNFEFHLSALLIVCFIAGGLAVVLDIYQNPTRSKLVSYIAGAVVLILVYVALDYGWVTALTLI